MNFIILKKYYVTRDASKSDLPSLPRFFGLSGTLIHHFIIIRSLKNRQSEAPSSLEVQRWKFDVGRSLVFMTIKLDAPRSATRLKPDTRNLKPSSPSDQRAAPGEPAAENRQTDQILCLKAAITCGFIQGDGTGC